MRFNPETFEPILFDGVPSSYADYYLDQAKSFECWREWDNDKFRYANLMNGYMNNKENWGDLHETTVACINAAIEGGLIKP